MTVIMKPIPKAKAINLRFFLSITMFAEYSVDDESNSDVVKSIIAITANQRPMSDKDKGDLSRSQSTQLDPG
jgi:hypothetical protein